MSETYQEIVEGETLLRLPPGERHERVLSRLHVRIANCLLGLKTTRLLPPRSVVQLSAGTLLRPDLALVTAATNKLWLVAEVISSDDHHPDTVAKKMIYEEFKVPRVWMVDPRYDNVEVYHSTQYGMSLKQILAGREFLVEPLLPGFKQAIHELFAGGLSADELKKLDF